MPILLPKVDGATKVNEYRPISLLNVIYKNHNYGSYHRLNSFVDKVQTSFLKELISH